MADTLLVIEASSLAITEERRLDMHGGRIVRLTVVEGYAPVSLAGKVIDAGEQTVASVPLGDEALGRLYEAIGEVIAQRRAGMDVLLTAVMGRK